MKKVKDENYMILTVKKNIVLLFIIFFISLNGAGKKVKLDLLHKEKLWIKEQLKNPKI